MWFYFSETLLCVSFRSLIKVKMTRKKNKHYFRCLWRFFIFLPIFDCYLVKLPVRKKFPSPFLVWKPQGGNSKQPFCKDSLTTTFYFSWYNLNKLRSSSPSASCLDEIGHLVSYFTSTFGISTHA